MWQYIAPTLFATFPLADGDIINRNIWQLSILKWQYIHSLKIVNVFHKHCWLSNLLKFALNEEYSPNIISCVKRGFVSCSLNCSYDLICNRWDHYSMKTSRNVDRNIKKYDHVTLADAFVSTVWRRTLSLILHIMLMNRKVYL